MAWIRAITLALLLVLAGCSGSVQETTTTQTPTQTTTVSETTVFSTTPEVTPTKSTTTARPTTTEPDLPNNPWQQDVVTVTVYNYANDSRNLTPLVNETLRYWNQHASTYGDYNVTFRFTPANRSADVVLEYVHRIPKCGEEDTDATVGCAPLLDSYSTAEEQETVQVVTGYSDNSTLEILKHEFGHMLGIEHGEEPMPTMRALARHTYLSQPDASERALPWRNDTLSVYVNTENVTSSDRDEVAEQIGHALSYFERGADGTVPENVSFVRTSNRSAADVRIQFPDDTVECRGERMREGSCGTVWAYNTDVDEAYEYYSRSVIRVRGIDEDAVGWHVGYWLADAFGLRGEELPEVFVDADYQDRRDEWWE